jgi:hypothetical protein
VTRTHDERYVSLSQARRDEERIAVAQIAVHDRRADSRFLQISQRHIGGRRRTDKGRACALDTAGQLRRDSLVRLNDQDGFISKRHVMPGPFCTSGERGMETQPTGL